MVSHSIVFERSGRAALVPFIIGPIFISFGSEK